MSIKLDVICTVAHIAIET